MMAEVATPDGSVSVPPDLIERLAGIAVRVGHEAADMLALAAPLPIPEWSIEIHIIDLQSEMVAVMYEWPDLTMVEIEHIRAIAGIAFERRLAWLTAEANLGGHA